MDTKRSRPGEGAAIDKRDMLVDSNANIPLLARQHKRIPSLREGWGPFDWTLSNSKRCEELRVLRRIVTARYPVKGRTLTWALREAEAASDLDALELAFAVLLRFPALWRRHVLATFAQRVRR